MRRTFVFAAACAVVAAASLAPIAAQAHPTRHVERRGVHVVDAREIRAAEARIRRLVFEARRDGFVTRRERARIQRAVEHKERLVAQARIDRRVRRIG